MPKKKDAPYRVAKFVQVPRGHVPQYGDMPWSEVVAAALAGYDGLSTVSSNFYGLPQAAPDHAWLRESPSGGCLLFQQNWIDDTNDRRWRRVP